MNCSNYRQLKTQNSARKKCIYILFAYFGESSVVEYEVFEVFMVRCVCVSQDKFIQRKSNLNFLNAQVLVVAVVVVAAASVAVAGF